MSGFWGLGIQVLGTVLWRAHGAFRIFMAQDCSMCGSPQGARYCYGGMHPKKIIIAIPYLETYLLLYRYLGTLTGTCIST